MSYPSMFLSAAGGAAVASLALLLAPRSTMSDPRVAEALQRLDRIERQPEAAVALRATLQDAYRALERRVAGLEEARARRPVAAAASSGATQPAAASVPPAASQDDESAGSGAVTADEFRGLMAKVLRSSLDGTATEAEQERFWLAARTTDLVDASIDALEQSLAADPRQEETRMELADAYVAKLLTVPAGPERGLWGSKAEAQWQAVATANPDHWDAHYTLAYNYSMYPDFMNKTDEAVAAFETVVAIQQRTAIAPEHARTYVQLARLHTKQGQPNKARAVLEQGQVRHPGDSGIEAALRSAREESPR
ncbi:MAG: tetratricopeptide repeat protein [Planctomycetota bacterium]